MGSETQLSPIAWPWDGRRFPGQVKAATDGDVFRLLDP
jgi:hypothetical protein